MQRLVGARIHVLLARDAASAVVIRRGPTRHTALVGWDRKTDQFKVGQWLYGRVYERRCDISPDGKHLIYFAMNGRWDSSVKGSWTAISKTPYLRALSLFAKGNCWNGGDCFNHPHNIRSTTDAGTRSNWTTPACAGQTSIHGTSRTGASARGSTTYACNAMGGR